MNVEDSTKDDIVEFIHPVSKKSESGKFGVGKFVRTIQRRNGSRRLDIELIDNLGDKTIIQDNNIRWDWTEYHITKAEGSVY